LKPSNRGAIAVRSSSISFLNSDRRRLRPSSTSFTTESTDCSQGVSSTGVPLEISRSEIRSVRSPAQMLRSVVTGCAE
jgi:hypothetical protein